MSLPDPATDPAGYVLAVANQREQRANAATPGPYYVQPNDLIGGSMVRTVAKPPSTGEGRDLGDFMRDEDCEHIAAEANPDHALAEVALWRGIAQRHRLSKALNPAGCYLDGEGWPCPDLLGAVEAAKAYAGDTARTETGARKGTSDA